MKRLALRALHTYASGGEIVGLDLGLTGIVFGMNAHGREVVEGRAVMQVRELDKKKIIYISRISGILLREISFKIFLT